MELIIISGRSGSGKSVALRALEDVGYYCVDNIPLQLIPALAQHLLQNDQSAAVSLDIRNLPREPELLDKVLSELPESITVKLIYLTAERNALIRRYSDSRRLHPLAHQEQSLERAIDLEAQLLAPLEEHANYLIDTTNISSHALAERLRELLRGASDKTLHIVFESFGFKYALPADADYVFDVRFLPNPHWYPELRPMTGLEKPVMDFLASQKEIGRFIYQTRLYLEQWLPMLERNNRSYLTIAIGCTGGKHRSVYVAEQLAAYFKGRGKLVSVRHRSLEHHKKQKSQTAS